MQKVLWEHLKYNSLESKILVLYEKPQLVKIYQTGIKLFQTKSNKRQKNNFKRPHLPEINSKEENLQSSSIHLLKVIRVEPPVKNQSCMHRIIKKNPKYLLFAAAVVCIIISVFCLASIAFSYENRDGLASSAWTFELAIISTVITIIVVFLASAVRIGWLSQGI